jgi:hypothetical protein
MAEDALTFLGEGKAKPSPRALLPLHSNNRGALEIFHRLLKKIFEVVGVVMLMTVPQRLVPMFENSTKLIIIPLNRNKKDWTRI